jgi:hypothetical protein
MADPRKVINWRGVVGPDVTVWIDNSTITYSATVPGGSAAVGKAVKLSDDSTVALATDGSMVLGELRDVKPDGSATVRMKGAVRLPGGNGAALTIGKAVNAQAAGGYIREVATGTAGELGLCRGMIVTNNDTAAVDVVL